MPITPRIVVIAARLSLPAPILGIFAILAQPVLLSPFKLGAMAWVFALVALLAFPRVRRNDIVRAVAGLSALAGLLSGRDPFEAAGLALCPILACATIPLAVSAMSVRRLAVADAEAPITDWKGVDRRGKALGSANAGRKSKKPEHE